MLKLVPAAMISIVGMAVFLLPYWLPALAEVQVTDETFVRCGQIGGGLIGLGVVVGGLMLLAGRKNRP